MERSFTELREIVKYRKYWERWSLPFTIIATLVAVYLVWDHRKEQEEIAAERALNLSFGPKGRVIAVYESTGLWDHLSNTPVYVTLENGERPRPKVTTVRLRNLIRPHVGKVWDLRIVDPDREGRCVLRMERRYDNHPWPELTEPIPGYEPGRFP